MKKTIKRPQRLLPGPKIKIGPVEIKYVQVPYEDRYIVITIGAVGYLKSFPDFQLTINPTDFHRYFKKIQEFYTKVVAYEKYLDISE